MTLRAAHYAFSGNNSDQISVRWRNLARFCRAFDQNVKKVRIARLQLWKHNKFLKRTCNFTWHKILRDSYSAKSVRPSLKRAPPDPLSAGNPRAKWLARTMSGVSMKSSRTIRNCFWIAAKQRMLPVLGVGIVRPLNQRVNEKELHRR